MKLSDRCVYTIRHSDVLRDVAELGGSAVFTEGRAWSQAVELLKRAQELEEVIPVLFAPAERTDRIVAWGLLDAVVIREAKPRTEFHFSQLKHLSSPFKKETLLKAADGTALATGFIRPYAICQTPKSVLQDAEPVLDPVPLYPDEIWDESSLIEGGTRKIRVNAYERNPEARRKCIEHYGAICSVCQIRLSDMYGAVADGLIHVHHLKPLAHTTEERVVDPVEDLRPVCPNCHAVIHRRNPPLTLDEIRSLVLKTSE